MKYDVMYDSQYIAPVEAYTLYDGQLVPACAWQLLLAGFCLREENPV